MRAETDGQSAEAAQTPDELATAAESSARAAAKRARSAEKKRQAKDKRRRQRRRARANSPIVRASAEVASALVQRVAASQLKPLQRALTRRGYSLFPWKPDHHYVQRYYGPRSFKLRSPMDEPDFVPLARFVRSHRRTFLHYNRLWTLYQGLRNVLRTVGDDERVRVLEVGVYRGGSSYFLATAAQELAPGRVEIVSVDTFSGHSELDLPEGREGRHKPSKFADTSYESVVEYLSPFPFVEVVKGRIQDVGASLDDRTWHMIHVDVDIYEPTSFTLEFAAERLAHGGLVVVDDYNFLSCPGARLAVDEFWDECGDRFVRMALDSGQCCLIALR